MTDPLVTLIEHALNNIAVAILPMRWPVDILPILNYLPERFPGLSFKKTARKWREVNRMVAEIPYKFVVDQMTKGISRPSFVSALIEDYHNKGSGDDKPYKGDHEKNIMEAAAVMYAAGAETTVTTLIIFVLAMVKFPAVQKKAQQEIDNVTGGDRLVEFEDREKLPYVNAMVKESLRWCPILPLCLTHATTEEMIYEGYRIPKGAYLVPSVWWFTHDPKVYSDPHSFDPERYFAPRNEPDPASEVFGYGRRICSGRYLADDSLFITIARLLTVLNIEKAIDEQGKEIDPELDVSPGVFSRPSEFPYRITPRSDKHKKIIESVETEYPWERSDASSLKGFSDEKDLFNHI